MKRLSVISLISVLFTLAACAPPQPPAQGGSGTANPPFEGPAPEGAMVTQSTPGTYGGTLVMSIPNNPKSFNPITGADSTTAWVINGPVYRPLTDWDNDLQKDIPAIAESWESSPDGLAWTFKIRKGIKWSDGAPLDADDVMFSYQVTFDPKIGASARSSFEETGGTYPAIEKLDDHTIRFNLKEPNAIFVAAVNSVYIVPKHKLEPDYKSGNFNQTLLISADPNEMVASGPYRVKSFTADQRVELERNPHYWKVDTKGQRLPYIDRVVFLIVPDFNAGALKFSNGETDMIHSLSPDTVSMLQTKEQQGDYKVYDLGPSLNIQYLAFNQDTGRNKQGKPYVDPVKQQWFRNVKFRQAASYAIDREGIVRTAFQDRGTAVYSFDSPANKTWYTDNITKYPYNPEKAKELLKEIGILDRDGDGVAEDAAGHPIRFRLNTNSNRPYRINMATLVKDNLSKVGMQVDLQPLDPNLLLDKMESTRDFDALVMGWQSGFPPDPILSKNVLLPSGRNYTAFPNQKEPSTPWEKELIELINLCSKTNDLAKRQEYYWRAMQIWTEYLPEIDLAVPNFYVAAKNRFGNFKPSPLANYTYWNIEELFFTK